MMERLARVQCRYIGVGAKPAGAAPPGSTWKGNANAARVAARSPVAGHHGRGNPGIPYAPTGAVFPSQSPEGPVLDDSREPNRLGSES